jgi:hypothetical protein
MFKLEIVRSTIGIIKQATQEMKSSNRKIVAIGALRFGGLITALSIPYIMAAAGKWWWGYDDDDEEALRRSLPDYQKNNMLFFGPKFQGKPSFIDLGFMDPYSPCP